MSTAEFVAKPPAGTLFDFSVLRTLRKREGLTLDELSARSGVSAAVISKLERNQSQAELETLARLARVFGQSASDLLALAEAPLAQRARSTEYASDGFHFERLHYGNLTAFRGRAPSGACVSRAEIHQDDYEVCWVVRGRVQLTLPHQTLRLGAGEAAQFDAIEAHTYEALEPSELILLHLRKPKRF
ncbi:MAG: helix-turn-helix domain-containing protein [Opitutales bacterium]